MAQPLMPVPAKRPQGGGRRHADDRAALAAIVHLAQAGCSCSISVAVASHCTVHNTLTAPPSVTTGAPAYQSRLFGSVTGLSSTCGVTSTIPGQSAQGNRVPRVEIDVIEELAFPPVRPRTAAFRQPVAPAMTPAGRTLTKEARE
ncbi:hypothetical protein [Micromonospora carbonacea]|uniref:hypothetical protein n=1 Tax=Micromonospora carbonacea TaxID=47853 RepID=UPI003D75C356